MTTSSHFGCRVPLDLVGPILEYVWESGSREESQSDFATIALTCSAFSQEVERILYRSMTSRDLARQSAFIYRTAVDARRAGYVRTYHTLDLRIWMENMSRSLNTELTTYLRFLPTALQNMANLKELYYDTYSPNEQSWVNNARWRGVPDGILSPITLLTDNMPTFPFMLRHFACISHSSNFSSAVPFLESQSSLHSLTIRTAPTSASSMQKLMNPDILPNLIRLRCANAFAATIIRNRAIRMLALWLNAPAGRGQPISIFGDTDSSCATGSMEELRYLSFESPYRDAVRIGSYIVAATERADERASKLGSVSWMKDYLQSMQRLECLQILQAPDVEDMEHLKELPSLRVLFISRQVLEVTEYVKKMLSIQGLASNLQMPDVDKIISLVIRPALRQKCPHIKYLGYFDERVVDDVYEYKVWNVHSDLEDKPEVHTILRVELASRHVFEILPY